MKLHTFKYVDANGHSRVDTVQAPEYMTRGEIQHEDANTLAARGCFIVLENENTKEVQVFGKLPPDGVM
jgi:hypothetical protein